MLHDTECKDCNQKSMCEWANTQQCCGVSPTNYGLNLETAENAEKLLLK